ncbi:MAG TPA: 2Fe-2S iron-sulfur cluster binding domain-containing protein [Nevskia sp.]|nr:2Fe-2S iron-sulfur cluster binding domain-containing protein [Nevskia sp.]
MSESLHEGKVTIEAELDGVVHTVTAFPGQVVLEALEDAGLAPPYSCRAGACASCICKLLEGEVEMLENHVLEQDELDDRWVLSCQSVPKTPRVKVRYVK